MREHDPGKFVDELGDPIGALPHYFGAKIPYDHRSRRPLFGPLVTAVRWSLIRVLTWWLMSALERQDRVNRLVARALERLDERSAHGLDARLTGLEEQWQARDSAERADVLDTTALTQGLSAAIGPDVDPAPALQALRDRRRVVVFDLAWPALLERLRAAGAGVYGVDADARAAEQGRAAGLEILQAYPDVHLRSLGDDALDGAAMVGAPLQQNLGRILATLRQLRRTLRPGAPLAVIVPNADSLLVAARDIWRSPATRRPVPPALYARMLELAGFVDVDVRPLGSATTRLTDDSPDPSVAANMRLLNATLFGPPLCAVVARRPERD